MSGTGVTALQTALQKDGESVTVTGTFDDQTASAVTGFQEKYASTILTPNGLSNGTGYAGKATRAELNSLFGCGNSPVVCPAWGCNGPEPITTSTVTLAPVIQSITPSSVVRSTSSLSPDNITVNGTGFTANNNVLIFTRDTNISPSSIPSPIGAEPTNAGQTAFYQSTFFSYPLLMSNGNSISFAVSPSATYGLSTYGYSGAAGDGWNVDTTDAGLPSGTYTVYVENGNGVVSNGVPFTVNVSQASASSTTSVISPNGGETLVQGQSFTIKWSTTGNGPAEVGLDVGENGTPVIGIGNVPNTGSYVWTVPNNYSGDNFMMMVYGNTLATSSAPFSIVSPGSTKTPLTITSINPSSTAANGSGLLSGNVSITISGSGFTSTGNTVNFVGPYGGDSGFGGLGYIVPNVTSANGNTLSFSSANTLAITNDSGSSAGAVSSQLRSGWYNVFVTNVNGTSTGVTFTVAAQ